MATDVPKVVESITSEEFQNSPQAANGDTIDDKAPPDGGWQAWSQVGAAHIVTFFSWGIINSFGLFQTYYTETLSASPSTIAWIGSIQVFLIFFVGVFSGSAFDSGCRLDLLLGIGCLFNILGIFMTSIARTYIEFMLAHGVCCGIGYGLMFTPAISVVRTYFSRWRSFALAVVLCGTATGGMVIPGLLQTAIPRIGFAWSVRCVGLMSIVLLPTSCYILRRRIQPKSGVRLFSFTILRQPDYVLFTVAMFLNLMGLFFAFFFIPELATNTLGFSTRQGVDLLIILNGMGILGRLLPMWLADKFASPLEIMIPINLFCSILTFVLLATQSKTSTYVFTVLYGTFGAGLIGLFPACLSSFSTDLSSTGSQIGWGFTIASLAVLIGPPISGLLINTAEDEYWRAQVFAACCLTLGCAALVGAKLIRPKRRAVGQELSGNGQRSTSTIFMQMLTNPKTTTLGF